MRPTWRAACEWAPRLPLVPKVCYIPGVQWSGPQGRSNQCHSHLLGSLTMVAIWPSQLQRVVYNPRLGAPTTCSRFLRPFSTSRQEGGCSGHSGFPFFGLREGRAIKATRRRWMTYPCSLSGRAGVRLQDSPIPSLGLFSRRQTGSSCTPRALWLELVWIPGLQTLATAQSALDLSPPSKKKTYLTTSLFWIPGHLIHSQQPCDHLCLLLSGWPFSLLPSSQSSHSVGPSGLSLPIWTTYLTLGEPIFT